jgi:hypothetical protein
VDNATSVAIPGARQQQQHHEAGPADVYRRLLAQLFLHDSRLRKALVELYDQARRGSTPFDDAQVVSFFADYYVKQRIETSARRTFIFVEIADDAGRAYVRELLGRLSRMARNSDFSVCVASAYHPEIEDQNTISIPMHLRNSDDILRYVNLNLVAEWEERNHTVMTIGQKSSGVFLWAEIVVNILNAAIIEGATQEMIEYTLEEVPGDLHGLYEWMLSTLNETEKAESLILFQWAILAAEPMRLNDLSIAVRLTEPEPFALYQAAGPLMAFGIGTPFSMCELRQLRNSEITTDTPYQFHRWLRARSIGLLELQPDACQPGTQEPLGLQRVRPIHSSVRSFFLSGRGFACLAPSNSSISANLPPTSYIDISHYALLRACLTYLNMRDFEGLGHRRPPISPVKSPISNQHPHGSNLSTRSPPSSDSNPQQHQISHPNYNHLVPPPQYHHPSPSLSRSLSPSQSPTTPLSPKDEQRRLVMSSYPFLQYAVAHLLHHLLSPTPFRYFLPQREVLAVFGAHGFRLWKRWTLLLGVSDADGIIALHTDTAAASTSPSAAGGGGLMGVGLGTGGKRRVAALLSPVYGARFRLERVLRKLERSAAAMDSEGAKGRAGTASGRPGCKFGAGEGVVLERKELRSPALEGVGLGVVSPVKQRRGSGSKMGGQGRERYRGFGEVLGVGVAV